MDESTVLFFGYDRFDAAVNMALDEALLRYAEQTERMAIRLYSFSRPSIILANSDHADNIKSGVDGVDISRRETGGKPIYVDDNILAYSIVGPLGKNNGNGGTWPLQSIHQRFGAAIADAIRELAQIDESDITLGKAYSIRVRGMPIAGHGQRVDLGRCFLYHGVVALYPWNAELINSLLVLRREDYEAIRLLPSLDTISKTHENNKEAYRERVAQAILGSVTNGSFDRINDSDRRKIIDTAMGLAKEKYSNPDWVFRREAGLKKDSRFCLLYEG